MSRIWAGCDRRADVKADDALLDDIRELPTPEARMDALLEAVKGEK